MAKKWVSPDGDIEKLVIVEGIWGPKPAELSECEILITDCPDMDKFNHSTVIIGYIYQWHVDAKINLTLHHKKKGVELFKTNRNQDAAYRFIKAIKIISSIPLDVESPPEHVDDVDVNEIKQLKTNLFNNLSTCYLKLKLWSMVIALCKTVLRFDSDNVKATYKLGVAHMHDRNFDGAKDAFEFVLTKEDNKAALDYLNYVKNEIQKADTRVNMLFKKMFC